MPKYKNQRFGGCDSKKEARRAEVLKLMQSAGEIADLEFQRVYELVPRQMDGKLVVERAITYRADASYSQNGRHVVEDTKSPMTRKLPAYVIKRKLMRYFHGIAIREV